MKIGVKGLPVYSAEFRPVEQRGVWGVGRGAGTQYRGPTVRVALIWTHRVRGSPLGGVTLTYMLVTVTSHCIISGLSGK